jgi:hypothetical protein
MTKRKCFLFVTASLLTGVAMGQPADPKLIESVRELADSRATLDVCMASPAFKKLADSTQRRVIAISNRIDRLGNDLHEAPKGKLLFVSYGIRVTQLGSSADFGRQLRERPGGVCDFNSISAIDSKLKIARRYIPPP